MTWKINNMKRTPCRTQNNSQTNQRCPKELSPNELSYPYQHAVYLKSILFGPSPVPPYKDNSCTQIRTHVRLQSHIVESKQLRLLLLKGYDFVRRCYLGSPSHREKKNMMFRLPYIMHKKWTATMIQMCSEEIAYLGYIREYIAYLQGVLE